MRPKHSSHISWEPVEGEGPGWGLGSRDKQHRARLSRQRSVVSITVNVCTKLGEHTKKGATRAPGAGRHQESFLVAAMPELRFSRPRRWWEGGEGSVGRRKARRAASTARPVSGTYLLGFVYFVL